MSTPQHYAALVWESPADWYTAVLLDDNGDSAAVASTPERALSQLKEYLVWAAAEDPWGVPQPELEDPQVVRIAVPLRPEYRVDERVYPCQRAVPLLVVCVHGQTAAGLRVAVVPRLGIRFYFHALDELKKLVVHFVDEALKGSPPADVAPWLPPRRAFLERLTVRLPERRQARGDDGPPVPALEATAQLLTDRALLKRLGAAWEREAEVDALVAQLEVERASVLLVGAPGAGKSTLLAAAVRRILKQRGAEARRRFWLTSGGRLIAGMRYLGQWQARCEAMIAELEGIGGVLCVERLLDLATRGGTQAQDSVASFLMPFVAAGELQLVAEVTPTELTALRRLLPGLAELFATRRLVELDRAGMLRVLSRLTAERERNLAIEVGRGTPETVQHLFARFMPYASPPGPAATFVRELFEDARKDGAQSLGPDDVVTRFGRRSGLPVWLLDDRQPLDVARLRDRLAARVIGQPAAVEAATGIVTTLKAGLNDPGRPLGVLLLVGPTGVGKTELARALADELFGHGAERERLLRLDMSEYADPGAAGRLAAAEGRGASPLIESLRRQPFRVVLFDEIEKAHPDVFDVLLGVLDEGRLTDPEGRQTTFRSAVLLMTSNLGARAGDALGFGDDPGPDHAAEAMRFFRPELVNRIDQIVTFGPLSKATIHAITARELGIIAGREGLAQRGLELSWSEEAVALLARVGFDPRYGARPLLRTLERRVVAPLARLIVDRPGLRDARLALTVVGDEVALSVA